ncbi:MAG: alpha-glucosidase C-terminal domain-containing protein [Limnochordia bacterium]|jgi:hypothetical protein|nr:alpha-glucosidase C-terminal domain-containing protein [Limnochordia bacterium]
MREWKDEKVLVLHNLNAAWQSVQLDLCGKDDWQTLYSDGEVEWGKDIINLSPRSSLVIEQ